MKKIAIIYYDEYWNDDFETKVAHTITNWAEVSDEEYSLLDNNLYRLGNACIIEQPLNQIDEIPKTIEKCLLVVKKLEEEEKKHKEITEQIKLKREQKKLEKEKQKALDLAKKYNLIT